MWRFRSFLRRICVVLLLAGCGCSGSETCLRNTDCARNATCVEGRCLPRDSGGGSAGTASTVGGEAGSAGLANGIDTAGVAGSG